MAAVVPLIGEMLRIETAPIRYQDEGRRHRVKIGSAVDIEIEDFVPPQSTTGEVSKLTGMFHPANSTLTIAKATKAGSTPSASNFRTTARTVTPRRFRGLRELTAAGGDLQADACGRSLA
jgi:hypothetical protein